MAPPYHSKKPSSTTYQASSRRGTRQVKQQRMAQYEEEVADDFDDAGDLDNDQADELGEGAVTSQPNAVQKLLQDMQADQLKRNDIRKKGIYKAYKEAHTSTQESISAFFDEHEVRASEAHDAQMAHLRDLIKMKSQIEAMMMEKLGELRKGYAYHSRALELVLEHRLKQLN